MSEIPPNSGFGASTSICVAAPSLRCTNATSIPNTTNHSIPLTNTLDFFSSQTSRSFALVCLNVVCRPPKLNEWRSDKTENPRLVLRCTLNTSPGRKGVLYPAHFWNGPKCSMCALPHLMLRLVQFGHIHVTATRHRTLVSVRAVDRCVPSWGVHCYLNPWFSTVKNEMLSIVGAILHDGVLVDMRLEEVGVIARTAGGSGS